MSVSLVGLDAGSLAAVGTVSGVWVVGESTSTCVGSSSSRSSSAVVDVVTGREVASGWVVVFDKMSRTCCFSDGLTVSKWVSPLRTAEMSRWVEWDGWLRLEDGIPCAVLFAYVAGAAARALQAAVMDTLCSYACSHTLHSVFHAWQSGLRVW